jgi:hypothetical protein
MTKLSRPFFQKVSDEILQCFKEYDFYDSLETDVDEISYNHHHPKKSFDMLQSILINYPSDLDDHLVDFFYEYCGE